MSSQSCRCDNTDFFEHDTMEDIPSKNVFLNIYSCRTKKTMNYSKIMKLKYEAEIAKNDVMSRSYNAQVGDIMKNIQTWRDGKPLASFFGTPYTPFA